MSLATLLEHYGYLAVFVGTFAEGESMLLLGGYAAHMGYLALPWVLATAYVAAVASDQLYFRLGKRFGHQLLAPSSSAAVVIHGRPAGSLRKAMPPKRPCSRGIPE